MSQQPNSAAASPTRPVVNSWNEWDPLEEVIVGTPLGARIPPRPDPIQRRTGIPAAYSGVVIPSGIIDPLQQQLAEFIHILEAEGVRVRQPDLIDLGAYVSTPNFTSQSGYNIMNPRDLVLVVGDEIIEAPTPSRERHFEVLAYRSLFKEYFLQGARWTAAPKPSCADELYLSEHHRRAYNIPGYAITEFEPAFDAADFVRCGRDLFCQRGDRTNRFGIEWLRRHLGDEFRIHEVETRCPNPVHIDTTFVPLGPGKVLINPEWVVKVPEVCKNWDILEAPRPNGGVQEIGGVRWDTSGWISMNVFLLDEKRVFVEREQVDLIRKLKDWGFSPIPLPFNFPPLLGGSFHCVTLDIRRRGTLRSYV